MTLWGTSNGVCLVGFWKCWRQFYGVRGGVSFVLVFACGLGILLYAETFMRDSRL